MNTKYPRVEMQNIDKVSVSFKKGVVKVSFELLTAGPEILRLMYLTLTAKPLNAVFESPQAEMDLKITQVKVETGEVVG